ncbi:hypothetical protein DKX38_027628 [Salix brachista]|uniref:Uncharacterized protein n=1 Tax=Salix brachista TaxID=2182728 RepID=A0A5N5J4V5_9ROSI|nr:hypothetical protein DKX38_027628 [Salix brachista]
MALCISCGESSTTTVSAQFLLLRFFEKTIESFKHNVANLFCGILSCEPVLDPDLRRTRGQGMDVVVGDEFSNNKQFDGGGGDPLVFNVLDSMLKGSLDRLKSMRDDISLVKKGITGCALDANCAGNEAIIKDLCLGGKLGPALWLRSKMIQKGFVPDVLTHNYMVNGLCNMRKLEKADWLIREMLDKGPSPNCATYNTFIKGYCLLDNVDKALHLFSSMANSGTKPNRVTFNTLLHALCKKDLLTEGKKLLGKILDDDKKAASNVITSTILMDGSIKSGDMVEALGIWDSMLEESTPMDVISYNVVIHGFCLARDMKLAYSYSCQMLKRGLLPDVFTYNTLVSSLCKSGRLDEACYIHDVMLRMGVAPDEVSYKLIIQGLCVCRDVDKANGYLNCMLEKSLIPEPLVWNLIIDGYGRCGDIGNAFAIRDRMLSFGVVPNVFTCNALIHAQVKIGNILYACFLKKEMLLKGLFPDVVTYNLLIGAVSNAGHIHYALQLYDEMLRGGCNPDMITYTELIRGYCVKYNFKEAEELLAKLLKSGLLIDHVPFQILTKQYYKMKEPERAFQLYWKWLTGNKRLSSREIRSPARTVQNYYLAYDFSRGVWWRLSRSPSGTLGSTDGYQLAALIIKEINLAFTICVGGLNKSRLKHPDWVYRGNDKHNVAALQFKQRQLGYLHDICIFADPTNSELWLPIGAFLKLTESWHQNNAMLICRLK